MDNCEECGGKGYSVEYITRFVNIDGEWDDVLVCDPLTDKPLTYWEECPECLGLGLDTKS